MDCFFIGRLSGSKGSVWQYTAIDVASGFTWAELHSSERKPRSRHCQALLHRLAHELALAGWKLKAVITDNGSEFVSREFATAVECHGATPAAHQGGQADLQRLRRARAADDPRGVLAAELRPLVGAQDHRAARDLDEYLAYYNFDRAHTGRLTRGRVPGEIVYGARKMGAAR